MPRAPYLTKSRFKLATECPRKLYYTGKPEYANTVADDEFLQQLAEGGYQVGELAKLMHPGGREITARGHEAQLAERGCPNFCVRSQETCPRRRASLATNARRGGQVGATSYAAAFVKRSS